MSEKRILTKDIIKKVDDMKTQVVDVPEWGGYVIVKGISGNERDWIESKIYQASQEEYYDIDIRAALVAMSVVDENGGRVFEKEDVEWLGMKSAIALNRAAEVARKMSGMAVGGEEEAEKNLKEDQSEDSVLD